MLGEVLPGFPPSRERRVGVGADLVDDGGWYGLGRRWGLVRIWRLFWDGRAGSFDYRCGAVAGMNPGVNGLVAMDFGFLPTVGMTGGGAE